MAGVFARVLFLSVFITAGALGQGFRVEPKLKVGDPAPPLSISEWVKGSPVSLAKGKGKKVYVVEFWATWCGPCQFSIPELTSLQAQYGDQRLEVVGVTSADFRGNTLEAAKKYVDQWGDRMGYTVAFDKDTATNDAYMVAANQYSIPIAFVVDRKGNIAWIGAPLGPEMGEVVAQVMAGKFDPKKYSETRAKIQAKFAQAGEVARSGDFRAALPIIEEALAIDPGDPATIEAICMLYLRELQDPDGLRAWAGRFIDTHRSDSRAMRRIAQQLVNIIDLTSRCPNLALAAAQAAYNGDGQRKDPDTAATYALALYQVGALSSAIKIQEAAVASAKGGKAKDLAAILDFYKSCQKVQKGAKTP